MQTAVATEFFVDPTGEAAAKMPNQNAALPDPKFLWLARWFLELEAGACSFEKRKEFLPVVCLAI